MGGEASVGIIALGVRLYLDTDVAALGLKLPHKLRRFSLHLAGHDLVPGLCVARLFEYGLVVCVQDLRQAAGDGLLVLVISLYLGRTYVHGIHPGADGKDRAVAVINGAACGAHRRLAHLLGYGGGLVLIVLEDLYLAQARAQGQKRSYAAHRHKKQCAAKHHSVGPAAGRAASLVLRHKPHLQVW